MAFNNDDFNEEVFMGVMPAEIGENDIVEQYVVSEVPEDCSSFYNAVKDSLWQYSPEIASASVKMLRSGVAMEIRNNYWTYVNMLPQDRTIEEIVNEIRLGTHDAAPYVMMAMEAVINYKIKVSNEDGSTIFLTDFVSDKPAIWLKKVGPYFKGMVKVKTIDFAAAHQH